MKGSDGPAFGSVSVTTIPFTPSPASGPRGWRADVTLDRGLEQTFSWFESRSRSKVGQP